MIKFNTGYITEADETTLSVNIMTMPAPMQIIPTEQSALSYGIPSTATKDEILTDVKTKISDNEVKSFEYLKKYLIMQCQIHRGFDIDKPSQAFFTRMDATFKEILGEENLKGISESYCRAIMNTLRTKTRQEPAPDGGALTHDAS